MRLTRQRQIILQSVRENRCHPDADFIYHTLKPDYPELSLGTVYRNLNVLSEQGLIQRIITPFSREHYDSFLEPHYHFCCTVCHKIFDLDMRYWHELDEQAMVQSGHLVQRHETVFHGVCAACREKEEDAAWEIEK